MDLYKNFLNDIAKSKTTPLLIELNKKALDDFAKETGIEKSAETDTVTTLSGAKSIYDKDIDSSTNIIYIDPKDSSSSVALLEAIIENTKDDIKTTANLGIVKEIAKEGVSFFAGDFAGGLLDEAIGEYIDVAMDYVGDVFVSEISENAFDMVDIDYDISSEFVDKVIDYIGDISKDIAQNSLTTKIHLTQEAKRNLTEVINKLSSKENLTTIESLRVITKIALSIAISSPKLFVIHNPHKLDHDSLTIISLLLSISKDIKAQAKHSGVSFVYIYSDESFQPYQSCDEKHLVNQKLLDDQRRFAQRYAMLERPDSDIPTMAIKQSVFVGREKELEELERRYKEYQEKQDKTLHEVVVADAGYGKTTLIKRHIQNITLQEDDKTKRQITLKLLNQVGHSSSTVGLSSLKESIIKQARKLELQKGFFGKLKDKATSIAKGEVSSVIKSILKVDAIESIGGAMYDRWSMDDKLANIQHRDMGQERERNSKEEEFDKLDRAIDKLKELSDKALPIVLFIDDLQWIDESSAEYILTHLMKNHNIYIISSLRGSDGINAFKKAYENKSLNEYKLSLLYHSYIKEQDIDLNIDSSSIADIETIHTHIQKLPGMTLPNIEELLNRVIEDKQDKNKIVAKNILTSLSNKDSANTLFVVETINVLCDEKFNQKDEVLIKKDSKNNSYIYSQNIVNFEATIQKVFERLQSKYQEAFTHINTDSEFEQKFNLMAYAVLEERLHILKEHFKEDGDIAVSTLLLSSLLGSPFDSDIVANSLKAILESDRKLLQPLKEYIDSQDRLSSSLKPEHYEIIEEAYEILSRHFITTSSYEYRHNLLGVFLDRQLEYVLDSVFADTKQEAKDELYALLLAIIEESTTHQELKGKYEDSLDAEQMDKLLFYMKARQSVLKKGYENNSERWAEDYTISLNNLAESYKNQNSLNEAIKLEEESLSIRKALYEKNSDRWADLYAISLNNLASSYYKQNRINEAITLQEESLEILKALYEKNPDEWAKYYTTSLNNLAFSYENINRLNEAIKLHEESLRICKHLYEKNPDRLADSYTRSLNNLASSYKKQNRTEKAIKLEGESLSIRRVLYEKNPDRWADLYTISLNNLAFSYSNQNHIDDAIKLYEESLAILKTLYVKNPDRWSEYYTISLNNLAESYKNQNSLNEAIKLEEESLSIRKALYEKNSDRWGNLYAISLNNLAFSYSNQNHIDDAIKLQEESLEILKPLYKKNKDRWAEGYTTSLNNLASSYKNQNRIDEAIKLDEECLDIRKALYEKNPDRWAEDYTVSLNNLAMSYYQKGNKKIALKMHYIAYEIATKHFGEQHKTTQKWKENYLYIKDELEKEVQNECLKGSIDCIFKIAKGMAVVKKSDHVELGHLLVALYYVELDKKASLAFEKIFDEYMDKLEELTGGEKLLKIANSKPDIPYSKNTKPFVDQLKKIFGDEKICKIR